MQNSHKNQTTFDFTYWTQLYQQDPVAFETKRAELLRNVIDEAPESHRHSLEQTLFKIEMTRKTAKNPLHATIKASKLMWESYAKLRDHLNDSVITLNEVKRRQHALLLEGKPPAVADALQDSSTSIINTIETATAKVIALTPRLRRVK